MARFDWDSAQRDDLGASLAYFAPDNAPAGVVVDQTVVDGLIERLRQTEATTLRICLHSHRQARFHDMLIAQTRPTRSARHRHPRKDETLHVVRGELGVLVFDEMGRELEQAILRPGELMRLPAGSWHTTECRSEIVVFHESCVGSFESEFDNEVWSE